jgi:aryl-alcohol dehydrogenase-like predicted oxidoreductase
MEHRRLGRTGVSVSKLCLGAMMFGDWGNKDHDESIRIIHRGLDAGINFIDTADVYSRGESEVIVGKALAGGRRDDVVLATKVHMPMGEDPNQAGNSRRWIIREAEESLRRLGTDWIDLYQIHRYDPDTDLDETLGALTDLVRAGKVRYVGHSTFPVSAIVEAQWTAQLRDRERFRCEQPPYSILTRGIENDVLPTCSRYGMGVIPYSPLAGGWLSGRYRKGSEQSGPAAAARPANRFDMSLATNQLKLDAAEQLAQLARQGGADLGPARHRVRPAPSGGDGGDYRPADDGAPGIPAGRCRRRGSRGRAGRHRRDRAARRDHQPGRQRVGKPRPAAGVTTPVGRPGRRRTCRSGGVLLTVARWSARAGGPAGARHAARPQVHLLALRAEDNQQFERAAPDVGRSVRNPGVELGCLTACQDEVLVAQGEPQSALDDVEPFVALVHRLLEALKGLRVHGHDLLEDVEAARVTTERKPGDAVALHRTRIDPRIASSGRADEFVQRDLVCLCQRQQQLESRPPLAGFQAGQRADRDPGILS